MVARRAEAWKREVELQSPEAAPVQSAGGSQGGRQRAQLSWGEGAGGCPA